MATFNVPVKKKTGEEVTEVEIQELIHATPVITFSLGDLEFAAQVSPNNIKGAHNNRISATQTKLGRMLGVTETDVKKSTKDKLLERAEGAKNIDIDELARVFEEMDKAHCVRAADAVMRDEGNQAMWNYPEPLTPELLMQNAALGDAFVSAVNAWWEGFTGGSQDSGAVAEQESQNGATHTTNTLTTTPTTQSEAGLNDTPEPSL